MDLTHKEAAENTSRTNTVGTFISTKSQTALRSKKRVKATRMRQRSQVKSGRLRLLTSQATLLEIFRPGSPAVAEAVKAIAKRNKLSASV